MLIRQVEIHSDFNRELVFEKIKNISWNQHIKYSGTDPSEFSFRMTSIGLRKYNLPLRISGIVTGSEKCTIKFKIYPNLGFWIVFVVASIAAIISAYDAICEGKGSVQYWLMVALFFGVLFIDLFGQQDTCQLRLKRALENS